MEPRGRVIYLMRPIDEILAEHPGKWIVVVPSEDQRFGRFVAEGDVVDSPTIRDAVGSERRSGNPTAILYSGNLIPEGSVIVV